MCVFDLRYTVFGIVGVCLVIGGICAAEKFPFAPMAMALLLFLCYAYVARRTCKKKRFQKIPWWDRTWSGSFGKSSKVPKHIYIFLFRKMVPKHSWARVKIFTRFSRTFFRCHKSGHKVSRIMIQKDCLSGENIFKNNF